MSSEHKNKRVIVHIKQASEIAGFVSKKGKSTSDCFAMVTLLGSSPPQKFNTKTIKKTTVKPTIIPIPIKPDSFTYPPFFYRAHFGTNGFVCKYNPHFHQSFHHTYHHNNLFKSNLQDEGENKVKIELFHYTYFGDNKPLGHTQATLDDIDAPKDLTLTLEPSDTDGDITTTGTLECRLLPVLDGEEPFAAFERYTSNSASPVTATLCATATPGIEGASTSTSTASGEAPEEGAKPWDKKKKAKTLNITLAPSSPTSASISSSSSGLLADSPRSLSESGNLGSPGFKRSASSFFRRNATTPRGEAPSISALALSYTCQKSTPLQQKEKRTPGGLTKKSLESLSIPRRSKRSTQAPKRRSKTARMLEKDSFASSNGGHPLVECFFVVTTGDLAGDVEERIEEIRHDDPEAPSRLVIDPLIVAYSGTVAEVCPDHGWDTLAPSVWMFCAPEGLFLSRGPRAPEVFPFVMTAENGERRYVTCLKHYVPLPHAEAAALYDRCGRDYGSAADPNTPTLYTPRIYCVSATAPCYTFCREWLCRIHALGMGLGEGKNFSLEAAVAYLLGVPAPMVGGTGLRATLDGKALCEVGFPPKEDYPQYLDVPLRLLFRMLSVENILLIFHSLLVEEKVLLVSRAKTVLTYVEEAITALMWPLRWSCIQISILPHQLSDFMTGPIVYLIGIPKNGANSDARGNLPDDALVVDLDNNTATPPKTAAAAATVRGALPSLPEDNCKELLADLKEYTLQDAATLDECGWRPWGDSEISDAEFNLGVRAAFLRFVVGLVRGYRESCRYIRVFPKPQMAIDEDLFARSAGKHKHPFYKAFSRSQALVGFLEAHKWPRENLFDTILEASTVGEKWAQSAHGIREYLRSISDSCASEELITVALKSTLPEKEAAEKRKIEEEEREEGEGEGRCPERKMLMDVDAVRTMRLPPYVVIPEDEKKRREEKKAREKEKDRTDSLGEGKPFVPHTNEFEYDDTADPAEGLDLYITIADAIIDGKAGSINEEVRSELLHRLETRAGRTIFSESLLSLNGDEVRKGREIQLSMDSCQMLGTVLRHGLEKAYMEDDIISPQLLFQVGSTFYEGGSGDLVLLLLKGAKIWNEQRFWETLFYRKAHEECAKLYPPSIFEEMTKWDEKSSDEKERIANTEVQALWKLLSDFCKHIVVLRLLNISFRFHF